MTPEEFFKLCEAHDWDYSMSEDRRVYAEGQRSWDRLIELSKNNPPLTRIYLAWYDYVRPRKPQLSDFVPQNQTPLTGQKD